MRKSLMIAAAGLALAVPVTASAAPAIPADAIRAALQGFSPVESAAWHCRRWSGWCRSSHRRHWHRRWRSRRW
jgi:hypothetical protein